MLKRSAQVKDSGILSRAMAACSIDSIVSSSLLPSSIIPSSIFMKENP